MKMRGGRSNWRRRGGRAALFGAAVLISACVGQRGASDAHDNGDGAKDEPVRVAHFRAAGPRGNLTIFSPLDLPAPSEARTIRGEPGPGYWQNRADYTIDATLDAKERTISAKCRVVYTNRSPHALDFLWLSMDQNLYKMDSDGAKLTRPGDRFGNLNFDGGFEVSSVRFEDGGTGALEVHGTLARLDLAAPLGPGGTVVFAIAYTFKVPEYGSDRMGILECRDGDIFQIGQWFPQVCKFDDVSGWNTLPYLGDGEFYTDFGDYRVSITVPADHLVAATGELVNEDEVLGEPQRERMSSARSSGEPVVIRSIDEIADDENTGAIGTKTWKFEATNCRTFGWASSRAFAWDACALDVQTTSGGEPAASTPSSAGRSVLCQSFYPRESGSLWGIDGQGGGSTRMLRDSIANYSRRWHPYPYPSATNVAGCVAGMEYPMLVFCKENEDEHELWGVITHEIGHTWFPMMVNSDERRYAWMDEGFNTFLNTYATADRYEDEPVKHTITEFAHMHPAPLVQAVDTPADRLAPRMLGISQYDKPAAGLAMLREAILGPERFDRAFRAYIRRWAFKSPQPADFYRTMEDEAGVDLAWFWRGWFGETGVLDQAVTTVLQAETGGASESRNARVTFRNLGGMVCPVVYLVEYSNGTSERRSLPVEAWSVSDEWQTTWDVQGRRIRRVEIDPDHLFPDVDRFNNIWER